MEINGADLRSQLGVYKTAQGQANTIEKNKDGNVKAFGVHQDRVALSDQGQLVAEAQRAVVYIPDVRDNLVTEVRNDLENGTYAFDNQRSAEGLLRESLVNEAALYN